MNIGIIGSAQVAQTLAKGFLASGHHVKLGTRSPEKLSEWLGEIANENLSVGSNAEAAAFGELIVLATGWEGTKSAIELANPENFAGKVVIDVTNPLDFSAGPPPKLAVQYPESGGELVQRWLPDAKIVKAFNTVSAQIMIHPHLQEGNPDLFIAGDDDSAKEFVTGIATDWGWEKVHDLGNITNSYWLETFAMLWIYFGFRNNHWTHAFTLLMK
ncbi:MAG: NADPH-dependent F420 reductase [Candidatus Kapaibacterium sp.]